MLAELLVRVRSLLQCDTAAILVSDHDAQVLVARAASGLEKELYQNVRVPIGHGFAGRIAATQKPSILQQIDETTVANPILWEAGIRSMLGVPLLTQDGLFGVLHVGSFEHRNFTEDDIALLDIVGQRVVQAAQSADLAAERSAAKVLERSLVPPRLPVVPGLEFGARYASAADPHGVGGDWYDVFALPSGEVWVVVGDVAGRGLPAAVVMGRLRTMIRAYALQGGRPDEVLRSTDAALQLFDSDQIATALCIAIQPSLDAMLICSAGHPPPMLKTPHRAATPLDLKPEPLLGVEPDAARSNTSIRLLPHSLMLLYTDGLVERRGESLELGLERLSQCVTSDHPDAVCRQVLFRLVGDGPPQDDIVALALRRTGEAGPRREPRSRSTGGDTAV